MGTLVLNSLVKIMLSLEEWASAEKRVIRFACCSVDMTSFERVCLEYG